MSFEKIEARIKQRRLFNLYHWGNARVVVRRVVIRTAALEALQLCRKHYPWRVAK